MQKDKRVKRNQHSFNKEFLVNKEFLDSKESGNTELWKHRRTKRFIYFFSLYLKTLKVSVTCKAVNDTHGCCFIRVSTYAEKQRSAEL